MTRLTTFLLLLLSSPFAKGLAGTDSFGHFWGDDDQLSLLHFEWTDISESGKSLLFPAGSIKANLRLNPPLVLYGESHSEVAVSVNGYISTDQGFNGSDESNTCPFPGEVSFGGGARIAVLHDHLEVDPDGGGIYHQYFPVSPHSWKTCGVHVIQWENVRHVGSSGSFDFQVLLFDNFDIVMQFGPGNAEAGSGSTTGIQNLAASLGEAGAIGMKIACDFAGGIPANYVLAIQPPREVVTNLLDPLGAPILGSLREVIESSKDGTRIEFDSSLDGEIFDLAFSNDGSGFPLIFSDKVLCLDAEFGLDEGITIRGLDDTESPESSSVRVTEGSDVRFYEIDFEPHQTDPLKFTLSAIGDSEDVTANHCTVSHSTITPASDHPIVCNSTNMQLNSTSIYGGGILLNNGGDGSLFHFGLGESSIAGSPDPAIDCEGNYEVNVVGSDLNLNLTDVIRAVGHTDVKIIDSSILFNLGRGVEADLETGGFVLAEDSSISYNIASNTSQGGAIRVLGAGAVTLTRSTISGNVITHEGGATNRGGGIYMSSEGHLNITDTTFSGNRCEEGAAIYAASLDGGVLRDSRILRSTFSDNEATEEAVIRLASTDLSLEVSTIAENVGSPVMVIELESEVEFCVNTFHLNEAERLLSVGAGTEVEARENIFSLGAASFFVGAGNFISVGANLCDQSPAKLAAATDVLGVDPMLGRFATHGGYTKCYMPLPGSPAIDAGLMSLYCAFEDQRRLSRFVDGDLDGTSGVDIGSVEYQGQVIVTTHLDEVADPGAGVSLREALDQVSPGGLITFAEGMGGRAFTLSSPLILNKDVTISASSLITPPNISGGSSVLVFKLNGVQAAFNNLNIVDGRTAGEAGAGIQIVGGAEGTFDNCEVRRCRSGSSGGGLYVDGLSTLLMRDCLVAGNEVTAAGGGKGGGIYGGDGCEIELVRTQVSGNSTLSLGSGGGIAVVGGDPGALNIKRCSIVRNTCGLDGAGLHLEDVPSFVLTNTTISGNVSADGGGGGICATGFTTGAITFSTIADNASDSGAGGIDQTPNSDVTISNTILAANRNAGGLRNAKLLQKVTSNGYNLCDDNGSLESGLFQTDIVNQAAHLTPLANYGRGVLTHSLLQISPAIDGGSLQAFAAPPVDQRGYARIQDGDRNGAERIDIGAFEAGRPAIVTTELDETANNGETSLREALVNVNDGGRIVFDPLLSGLNINLSAAKGVLTVDKNIQIDATALPGGIKIDGQNAVGCLRVSSNRPVALNAIQIKNGHTETNGGGIQSNGELVLNYCTLRDNNAVVGGGAIACSEGELFAWNSSFFSNTSGTVGSAVRLVGDARAKFEHCTIAENSSGAGEGAIGVNQNRMTFYSTLFAANGVHFHNDGGSSVFDLIETRGYNLVDSTGALLFSTFSEVGDVATNDPIIGAASNTGGWAPIIQTLVAGPARDAGNPEESLLASFDVRGFVRVEGAAIDIGSVEFNGKTADSDADEIPDWWELLYGFDPDDSSDANDDPDADNESNLAEYQAGTNPLKSDLVEPEPDTPVSIIAVRRGALPGQLEITFASDSDAVYRVEGAADLEELDDDPVSVNINGAAGASETTVMVEGFHPRRSFFRVVKLDVEEGF